MFIFGPIALRTTCYMGPPISGLQISVLYAVRLMHISMDVLCHIMNIFIFILEMRWEFDGLTWYAWDNMAQKACCHTEHYIMAKAIFQSCAASHGCKHVPAVWYTAPNLLPVWTPKPSAWMARRGWIVRFYACCMGGKVGSTTRLPYLIYEPHFSQQSRLEISSLVWTNSRWYSVMNHEVVKTHGL